MIDNNDSKSGLGTLFSELRRRRVLRTSAIYIAAAWVLLQVVALLFSMFDIDETYQRYAAIALFVGFPVAVVMSWLFDIDLGRVTRTGGSDDVSPVVTSTSSPASIDDFKERVGSFPLRSVGVMPFANVGGNEENEFFSDGIAEELINLLSKSSDLNVAARTSSFSFRNTSETVQAVASRLGVRHILEGSVRREQSRVRISVQLIDAMSGFQVWSSSYDRELTDIFAVQDEISSSIVYALSAAIDQTIGGTQSLRVEAPTNNIEAYQLYLRGMYLWQRRGKTAINAAKGALQQAITIDPDFVDAIALLAVTTAVAHEYTGSDKEADFHLAEQYAKRAMERAPATCMAHAVRGYIAMRRWQWAESESHFKLAIGVDRVEPLVHQWYSNLLNDLGRRDEALVHALKAYQADRLSPQANNILAVNFLFLGDNDAAIKHVTVAREFGLGGAVPDWIEYVVRLREQRYDAALDVMVQSLTGKHAPTGWVAPVVNAMADASLKHEAVTRLASAYEQGDLPNSLMFMQCVLLRGADLVFEVAEKQYHQRTLNHAWLFLPEARLLREDPRFNQLMKSIQLVEFWERFGRPEHLAAQLEADAVST